MSRPLLLDLFCGAGGAAMGYHRAGFDVVGVDIRPQPHYPFEFIEGDALKPPLPLREFDVIHASPPCQAYSDTKSLHAYEYPDLIGAVRFALRVAQRPYVIENVEGAPLLRQPTFDTEAYLIQLCGSSFGLGVRRHRLFESNTPLVDGICAHHLQPEPVDVTGSGASRLGSRVDGKGGNSRKPKNLSEARIAMGIDWMTRMELSQAIPPRYTQFIGEQLITALVPA